MSSLPTDKAEPNEALKVNTVWSAGLGKTEILLSAAQLPNFRCQGNVQTEWEAKGERGAYFVCSELELTGNKSKEWCFVAELNQDYTSVSQLLQRLRNEKELLPLVEKEVEKAGKGFNNWSTLLMVFRQRPARPMTSAIVPTRCSTSCVVAFRPMVI